MPILVVPAATRPALQIDLRLAQGTTYSKRRAPFVGARWFRPFGIAVLGVSVMLIIDVILALSYRNYTLFSNTFDYVFSVVFAFAITLTIRTVNRGLNKSLPWEKNPVRRFLIQASINIIISVGTVVLVRAIILFLIFLYEGFNPLFNEVVVLSVVAVVTLIFVFADLSFYLLQNWRNSLAEIERFRKENVETQFEMLKSQVNPHFLFNSLNTLSSLVYQDKDNAARFIRQLSRVYRHILENRDKGMIPLVEEMEVIRAYAELLELRFANNLRFEIQLDEGALAGGIAPLTLQMLIENAIKHNVVSKNKPLTISITSNDNNQVVVANNLQLKSDTPYSSEIGLTNIRSRYAYITDRAVEVEPTSTKFIVRIPIVENRERTDR